MATNQHRIPLESRDSASTVDRTTKIILGLTLLLVGLFLFFAVARFVRDSQLPIFPSSASSATDLPALPERFSEEIASLDEQGKLPEVGIVATPTRTSLVVPGSNEEADDVTLPPPATDPMTVLVMGIDRRTADNEDEGPWRTDSMILLTIDPESNAIAMLSFPRDMLVTIPDHGDGEWQDRINTAYYWGDVYDYPGGGAGAAMQMIRRNFGIKVDRYLVMDFDGFRKIIDYVGGVDINVPDLLIDTEYPTEDYGIQTIRFEKGWQHMNGERALQYARTRKSTSDFARAERQQEVILALRDQVLSRNIIPSLTPANVGRLVTTLNRAIETDITVNEVLSLAQVARRIEDGGIRRALIDNTMVSAYYTYTGAEVLIPDWTQVRPLVAETFDELVTIEAVRAQAPLPRPLPTETPIPTWTPRPRATAVPTWTAEPEVTLPPRSTRVPSPTVGTVESTPEATLQATWPAVVPTATVVIEPTVPVVASPTPETGIEPGDPNAQPTPESQ